MRVETILDCVAGAGVLADIGTDHAFIPIEAIKRKLAKKAIACDIASGPLEIGRKNVAREGLTEFIELRLGDGLEPVRHNEADTIVIAGMGGMRILGIIESGLVKIENANLVLQPQHDISKLRRGLFGLGIKIRSEHLAKEGERFYEVLCAAKSSEMNRKDRCGREAAFCEAKSSEMPKLTEKDFFLGIHTGELAPHFYLQKKQKIEKYIHLVKDKKEKEQAKNELVWLSEALPH